MAVPSGYAWARELDPNAVYEGGVLKALGRTYKPGEYYLEGGRAYIPNPVPEGYQWIRSYFAPGQVSYDERTRTINLPGGLSIPQSQLITIGGRTYAPASQLTQAYQTYAATYKPPEPTAEDVRRKSEALMQVYAPLMEAVKSRLGLNLKTIQEQAEQQRRLAEAAYQSSLTNLQRKETADWNRIVKSALTRGLGASPLTSYEQRKVAEAYAPEYQQLETNRAAQLANIAAQAALAADELAQQGQEQQAQWASQIAQYAYNALQSDAAEQKKAVQNLGDIFASLAEAEAKRQQEEAKLAWEKEKLAQQLGVQREIGLKDYLYGPSPADQLRAEVQRQAIAARLAGGGSGGYTPAQRIDDLFKVWQITGTAPAGLEELGVEPGTLLKDTRAQDLAEDRYMLIKRLTAPQGTSVTLSYDGKLMTFPAMTREEALQEIEWKRLAGIIDDDYAAQLRAIVDQVAQPQPPKKGPLDWFREAINTYGMIHGWRQ